MKNFAAINSNFLIRPGTKQKTVSETRDILAIVDLEETMPKEAGIFNMNEFLGVISLFNKPEFDFDDKFVTIEEGNNKIKYVYADVSCITTPSKDLVFPTPEITFDVTQDQLNRMQKVSSALSVGDIVFIGDGNSIKAKIFDVKNPTSNTYELELDASTTNEFEVYFKLDKLSKLFGGSYTLNISSKKIGQFVHKDIPLTCYISVEANSKFE
jgi:hypothetical protein